MRGRPVIAYVGTRTTRQRNARGEGLHVFRISAEGGWSQVQILRDLVNPSFLALDHGGRHLYAVHGDESEVSTFRVDDRTGELTFLGARSTEGRNPVHLALEPSGRFLVIANHITSTLALLPVAEDGSLGACVDLVALSGELGPHRIEQPFAKPHQVQFDPTGRFIVVPDKGLDRTFVFRLDVEAGRLVAVDGAAAQAREGAGPRHVAFHPEGNFAYVVDELASTITCCRFDSQTGTLEPFQVVPSRADDRTGFSRGAEIATSPDGRRVYVSNRGDDDIGVFAVDPGSGRLEPLQWRSTDGRTPRFFALGPTGMDLFAANEDSDTIVRLPLDLETGTLGDGRIVARVGSPVCILFS